jgi:hypothetical protein
LATEHLAKHQKAVRVPLDDTANVSSSPDSNVFEFKWESNGKAFVYCKGFAERRRIAVLVADGANLACDFQAALDPVSCLHNSCAACALKY